MRQLDHKLPEDDNASFAPDNGMPYVPEPSVQATHVSSAPRTGLYIVLGLGCAVIAVIAFVLFQAYRAGELPRYFATTGDNSINSGIAPVVDTEAPPHALPVDANDTSHSVRALPVDANALAGGQEQTRACRRGGPIDKFAGGDTFTRTSGHARSRSRLDGGAFRCGGFHQHGCGRFHHASCRTSGCPSPVGGAGGRSCFCAPASSSGGRSGRTGFVDFVLARRRSCPSRR